MADAKVQKRFQRARRPEHKEERRSALLRAAAELLDAAGIDGVTLSAIAKKAGVSKSNLYTYFESREDLLLTVLLARWKEAVEEAEVGLAPFAGCDDPARVAQILAAGYLARPQLCALSSVLSSVLEQNVSEERIVAFKRASLILGVRLTNMLSVALPSLPFDRCAWVLRPMFAVVAGLWPVSQPPPAVARALTRPDLALMCIAWEDDLARSFEAILRGELMRPAQ
ncbi:MAG: TetR family transcriptional regulator [Myxococcota bacterium]